MVTRRGGTIFEVYTKECIRSAPLTVQQHSPGVFVKTPKFFTILRFPPPPPPPKKKKKKKKKKTSFPNLNSTWTGRWCAIEISIYFILRYTFIWNI